MCPLSFVYIFFYIYYGGFFFFIFGGDTYSERDTLDRINKIEGNLE